MSLITQTTIAAFDLTKITKDDFIRAQHKEWAKPINGIVSKTASDAIRVWYQPETPNVTQFFYIIAADVQAGNWALSVSEDLVETITVTPPPDEPEPEVTP